MFIILTNPLFRLPEMVKLPNKSMCLQSIKQNSRFISSKIASRNFSTRNDLLIKEEINVPTIHGDLSGILWKGPNSTKTSTKLIQPPIICIHGTQDNCGTFESLIPLILKDDMTIFALDLPGHGLSYHTKGPYYDYFLDGQTSMLKVLKHFGWEKATLLGHSLGSIISFIFSGTYPQHVHKYIALDNLRPVPAIDATETYRSIVKEVFSVESKLNLGKERPSYLYEEMLEKVIKFRKNTVSKEGCQALLKRGSFNIPGTNRYQMRHDIKTDIPTPFRLMGSEQTEMIGRRIKCPVCVIKGEPGEDYEPRENFLKAVENLKKYNPQSVEYHLVPGTHHFHLNTPDLVAPIINKFLEM